MHSLGFWQVPCRHPFLATHSVQFVPLQPVLQLHVPGFYRNISLLDVEIRMLIFYLRILYKDEQSRIICKIGFTLDFEIISLIPRLGVLLHY